MTRLAPRHGRFVTAFGIGALVALVTWVQGVALIHCLLSGVNAFFVLYLGLMAGLVRTSTPAELRRHAAEADEGVVLILLLALLAVVVSVSAIFLVLNAETAGLHARAAALISLPLGWTTVHVLAAFHYAHLYYRGAHPGMVFPGKDQPDAWDFLYASFTIGMTAQVSDFTVESRPMRQAVLVHGVASFFYNTCILALAVNAAVTAGV
jgi:uncharacterized membrane protein